MTVLVNKKGNYSQLRLLFPTIQFATQGYPVYAKICFTTEEYDVPEDCLLLVQSPAGVALDTQSGLVKFMQTVSYMAPSKIDRFSKTSSFGTENLVYTMYKEAACLRLANRGYLSEEATEFKLDLFLKMSLYSRLEYCGLVGYETSLKLLLGWMKKYYTRDESLTRYLYEQLSQLFLGFNTGVFKKEYTLTGDAAVDCSLLVSYLPEVSR